MSSHTRAGPGASTSLAQAEAVVAAGLRHHRAGQLAEAEQNYRAALKHRSDHSDALHLLGVIAIQGQRYAAAVALSARPFLSTQTIRPLSPILVSRSSTRADSTRRDRALALKPDYVEAWHNRGRVLQHLGRLDDALASYQRAVTLSPGLAESFNNSGAVLCQSWGVSRKRLSPSSGRRRSSPISPAPG
jgi:protein O-GlcNAc transferase